MRREFGAESSAKQIAARLFKSKAARRQPTLGVGTLCSAMKGCLDMNAGDQVLPQYSRELHDAYRCQTSSGVSSKGFVSGLHSLVEDGGAGGRPDKEDVGSATSGSRYPIAQI